ncbi:MAG: serine/threonine protein kinase [Lachnospiraceae bacterium]|nr:serine/threonine protein kinase [Lachnospiraceae bacterium]
MLINPDVYAPSDISWICDGCGKMLNTQPGFNEDCGEWKCTECGFINKIDISELYVSEDEFQAELRNPYRGLSDADALELSIYEDERCVEGRENIILARDRETGTLYIKKLLADYNKSVFEFLKVHPVSHMPLIKDLFESDNCLIVIEEFIEGSTVSDLLEKGPFPEDRAVRVIRDVCTILKDLHSLSTPIIHRDVKPSNIIITPEGEVYLLDMNVAKWFDPDKTDDTRYMGTRDYAAPEQVGYGLSASSAKTDIYAVGVMLNEMITLKLPKEEKAPGKIWEIIERCISLEAEKRYTAEELIAELDWLEGGNLAG